MTALKFFLYAKSASENECQEPGIHKSSRDLKSIVSEFEILCY